MAVEYDHYDEELGEWVQLDMRDLYEWGLDFAVDNPAEILDHLRLDGLSPEEACFHVVKCICKGN